MSLKDDEQNLPSYSVSSEINCPGHRNPSWPCAFLPSKWGVAYRNLLWGNLLWELRLTFFGKQRTLSFRHVHYFIQIKLGRCMCLFFTDVLFTAHF